MKRLAILALLLWPVVASAQVIEQRRLVSAYDLTSTSFIYCTMDKPSPGQGSITTSGSSTTVTETTTSNPDPFEFVAVGDVLGFTLADGGVTERTVTARASSVSITVNTAVTIPAAGVGFQINKLRCGTAATDGWVSVVGVVDKNWVINLVTINGTSIDFKVECKVNFPNAVAVQVWPPPSPASGSCNTGNFTAAGNCAVSDLTPWNACRVGMKLNTDSGAQSITSSYIGAIRIAR